jgi:ATP-binding protein involved in chromosome partitioning
MSYFIPPDMPDRKYDIFGSEGGQKLASELQIPLLGCIPLEIPVRVGGDAGQPIVVSDPDSAAAKELVSIAEAIAARAKVLALSP